VKQPQQPPCGNRRAQIAGELAERFIQDRLSVAELALLVGRRPSTVRRLLNEAGVQAAGPACVGLGQQETARILARRYEGGASIAALVRQTGMDKRVIRAALVEAGVVLPPRHSLTTGEAEQVVARYRAGESIRAVAAGIGCSYGTIRAALHAAQVTLRARGSNRCQVVRPCP
jgi:transposase-like protein